MATEERATKLKRQRRGIRSNITRFATEINNMNEDTLIKEVKYAVSRLTSTLKELKIIDNEIHDLLTEEEYELDLAQCEMYKDNAERAIFEAQESIQNKLLPTTNACCNLNLGNDNADSCSGSSNLATIPITNVPTTPLTSAYTVKLPTMKLEPFGGEIENWQSFWERFQSAVDFNPNISTIDKHVFLRGYLKDEPRRIVDGISITADTYERTKEILKYKYGNKDKIIQSHLDYLENLTPLKDSSPSELNELYIDCNRRLQALDSLGEETRSYGRILVPKILCAFPHEFCRNWIVYAKRENLAESDLPKLMKFLAEEVEGAVTAQKVRGIISGNTGKYSLENFHVSSKAVKNDQKITPFCSFCEGKGHWPQNCETVKDYETRVQKLKSTNRCFLCTNRGHRMSNCPRKNTAGCPKCKKKHHVSICPSAKSTQLVITNSNVNHINIPKKVFTHLQTARLYVTGPTGITKLVRCILDGGSQASFVDTSLIETLKLKVMSSDFLNVQAFESTTSQEQRRCVQLSISGLWSKQTVSITAFESSNTYTTHPAAPTEVVHFARQNRMRLADPPDDSSLQIALLIGGDNYWKIVTSEAPIKLSESFVMVPTMLGWVLSGSRTYTTISENTSVQHVSVQDSTDNLNDQIRCLWELDSIGIQDTQTKRRTAREEEILSEFHKTYEAEDNRRVVSLPWKPKATLFSKNKVTAEKRFDSLQRRLASNNIMKTEYNRCMLNYIEQGHVEVCPKDESNAKPKYYLPHHAVRKKTQTDTKWRIVFDASSHAPGMPSLNDSLEAGPNLLPEIFGCLLRFRMHSFAVTCDGKQAFLQLLLHANDRDVTRFLWYKLNDSNEDPIFMDEVTEYRFKRLPFGLTCSPFLLSAATRELAEKHLKEYPIAAPMVDKNLYMDDFLASVEFESCITILYQEIKNLMLQMKLPMEKWATNSLKLQSILRTQEELHKTETTILGIDWNTCDDTLGNSFQTSFCVARDKPLTKRWLLRCIASFYDPLGLYSPFTILGKIIFQDTWILGIKWDELLPVNLSSLWYAAVKELDDICHFRIPRSLGLSSHIPYKIHVFCDASERAYGAVLYVVTLQDNQPKVNLVCSRNKLAPIKRVTLPRLELLAALMGARLLKYFCTETNTCSSKAIMWSDSQVTLGWIRSVPNKWKTFVCNRVTEIVSHTNPSQWRHCPGTDNPADKLSRGVSPSILRNLDLWWNGPKWLVKDEELWPVPNTPHEEMNHNLEAKKEKVQTLHIATTQAIINAGNYSSYHKLLRVTSWVLRFIHNCKSQVKIVGELNSVELNQARAYWIQTAQKESFPLEYEALMTGKSLPKISKITKFNPFLENNMILLGGRLQFSDLSHVEKHPILLDGSHSFTKLLIRQTHIRMHHLSVRIVLSELRTEFWILRARDAIKKIIHTCLPCKIQKQRRCEQIEAPLPTDRVKKSTPFEITGMDFAGPLYVKNEKLITKAYIVIFTCAVTRAVHLEVVSDLSTDVFLLALRRFVSRRSVPHTVYSDNAKTFCAADKELKLLWNTVSSDKVHQFYAHHNIKWKFIAPRAAWWGGWWERLIGTIKQCLRKTLGKACLDTSSLTTVLCEIEAAVNSRPIVHEYDEDPVETLTPSHFLIGKRLTTIPSGPPTTNPDLRRLWRSRQHAIDSFWKRWQKEYLMDLRTFHQVKKPEKRIELKVGDVVLLHEDFRPRHTWKKALVLKKLIGRDGQVRTCLLRVNGQIISRPVQLVVPLEVDQGGEDVANGTSVPIANY